MQDLGCCSSEGCEMNLKYIFAREYKKTKIDVGLICCYLLFCVFLSWQIFPMYFQDPCNTCHDPSVTKYNLTLYTIIAILF
jgi:hypothetical protein